MKNLQEKMEKFAETNVRLSGVKIHQTDGRKLKEDLHEIMKMAFENLGLYVTEVENALVIEMPHNELGAVLYETKFVMKQLDYDVTSASEQFQEKLQARNEKMKAKEKDNE